MKWEGLCFLGFGLSLGCASTVTGTPAARLDDQGQPGIHAARSSPVVIRSRVLPELSRDPLPVVEVSFENRSGAWQRIEGVELSTSDPELANRVSIPMGDELYGWQLATQQRRAVEAANERTAWELVLAGALLTAEVGGDSKDTRVRGASALLGLTASSAFVAKHYHDRVRDAETPATTPSSHLLAGPIAVPPGAVVKRWVLLSAPASVSPKDLALVLSYDAAGDTRERVRLSTKTEKGRLKRAQRR